MKKNKARKSKKLFTLLIWQGLKGVFKFKIQFFLIIILGFFASLILSASYSIEARVEYEYKRTMKVKQFDYYEDVQLKTVDALNSKTNIFIFDFISDEYLKDENDNEGKPKSYNVNLSNASKGSKETFITRAFASVKFKEEFNKLINQENVYKPWFNSYDPKNSEKYCSYGNISKNNKSNYWFPIKSIDEDDVVNIPALLDLYTNTKKANDPKFANLYYIAKQFSSISLQTIKLLKEELKKDLDEENGIKKQNSIFGLLFKEGILNKKDIVDYNSSEYNELSNEKKEINIYMDLAFLTLIAQINKMIHDYIDYNMFKAIKESGNKNDEESVIKKFEEISKIKRNGFSNNDNATILYNWLFGKKESKSSDFGNFKNNRDKFYTESAEGKLTFLEENGKPADNLSPLKILLPNQTIEEFFNINSSWIEFKNDHKWENYQVQCAFITKQKLNAKVNNFSFMDRHESYFLDNLAEKNYRIIIFDKWIKENLTIYEGVMPTAKNEIIISPQYARANKIKLGQNINVAGAELMVTGFGADPFTNFPIGDIQIPFPNNKKEMILYIDLEMFSKIIPRSESKITTQYLYSFLWSNNKVTKTKDVSRFKSLNYFFLDKIKEDQNNVINKGNDNVEYNKYKLKNFKGSSLALNWTLTPKILKIFNSISYITCLVILSICIATTIISIRKTIKANASEIGILKALGAKSCQIALSYISYGLILTIFVVPISWFLGSFFQEVFVKLIFSYMGGKVNVVWFNWSSIFILIALFGLLIILVSFFTAMFLINKPVIDIINKKEYIRRIQFLDNIKLKLFKKAKFTTRFSFELAISGFKSTLISFIAVLITTLLISTSIAIPGVINSAVRSYYKNIKYSNKLENITPIGNSPLSKTSLSAWEGADYYEKYLINIDGNLGKLDYIGDSITNITGNTDYSMLSKFFYKDNNWKWTYEEMANENTFSLFGYIFGNNITQTIGKGINIADIQRILEFIVHNNPQEKIEIKIEKINKVFDLLENSIPVILKAITPGQNIIEGKNWKEKVFNSIQSQLPSYIKSYMGKNENRFNQYSIGWTMTNYIPDKDDFFTETVFEFDKKANYDEDNKILSLIGIDKYQKSYNLPKKAKDIFLENNKLVELQNQLIKYSPKLEPINLYNNFDLVDENGEINIPVIINDQAGFNLKKFKLNEPKIKARRLLLKITEEEKYDIPNNAWIYDDRDWLKIKGVNAYDYKEEKGFLNPADLDVSKFSMSRGYDYSGKIMDFNRAENAQRIAKRAQGFANAYINKEDEIEFEIRPYYSFDNLFLFIPEKFYENIKHILNKGAENKGWYGIVDASQVPNETKESWSNLLKKGNESITLDKFIWIRPYSRTYDPLFKNDQNNDSSALNDIFEWKNSFFREAMVNVNPIITDEVIDIYKDKKINLIPIDKIKVYGKSLILVDQNIANILHGYSLSTYLPYNYVFEKKETGSYTLGEKQIKTYEWYKPKELLDRSDSEQLFGDLETAKKSKWFTGVMSSSKEPYFLTSQASFSKVIRTGEYTLNGNSKYYDSSEISEIEFLTKQKALIYQISNLILSITSLFLVIIIVTSTLSMIIITDLYVNQYKNFMVVMKAIGYSNWKVIKYAFGTMSALAFIAMFLGIFGSIMFTILIRKIIQIYYGALPIGVSWWGLLISLIIVLSCFIISIVIATRKIRIQTCALLVN